MNNNLRGIQETQKKRKFSLIFSTFEKLLHFELLILFNRSHEDSQASFQAAFGQTYHPYSLKWAKIT